MEKTQIYLSCPRHFDVNAIIAGGFITHEKRFLMLKRHPQKHYGNYWNFPAGKVERGEDPHLGAQREIHEETGLFIPLESLDPVHIFYIKRAAFNIQFHLYKTHLPTLPSLNLKLDENIDALWLEHDEALKLPLLGGGKEILDFCLKS